jgi:hypothetical protein
MVPTGCYDVGISIVRLIKGIEMKMLTSTIQFCYSGTKCVSLMTRYKQPRNLIFCCASHAVVKLVPVDHLNCNYSVKGTYIDMISLLQFSLHRVSAFVSNTFPSLQVLQQYTNKERSVHRQDV